MLEYVRKRNGTIEKADASKINLWVTNLSKDLEDRLEWSKVLMEVVKESPSEMSSQDLQLAISKKFVAKKDWPGVLMGGRFYAIWHWKNLFGDKIPTVKEHHKQMVALGLMEDMGYTDEDYEQIEKIIDHNRDLTMAQFQLKQRQHLALHPYQLKPSQCSLSPCQPTFELLQLRTIADEVALKLPKR